MLNFLKREQRPMITSTDSKGDVISHTGPNAKDEALKSAMEAGTAIPTLEYAMKMQGETLEYLRNSLQSMDVKDLILMDEKLLNLNQKLEEEKQEMKRDPNRKNNLSKILMSILAIDGLALSAISMVAMVDTPTSKIENICFLAYLLLSGFLVTGISARELQRIEDSEFEINKDIEVLEKVQQVVNEFRHSLNQKRRISAVA